MYTMYFKTVQFSSILLYFILFIKILQTDFEAWHFLAQISHVEACMQDVGNYFLRT